MASIRSLGVYCRRKLGTDNTQMFWPAGPCPTPNSACSFHDLNVWSVEISSTTAVVYQRSNGRINLSMYRSARIAYQHTRFTTSMLHTFWVYFWYRPRNIFWFSLRRLMWLFVGWASVSAWLSWSFGSRAKNTLSRRFMYPLFISFLSHLCPMLVTVNYMWPSSFGKWSHNNDHISLEAGTKHCTISVYKDPACREKKRSLADSLKVFWWSGGRISHCPPIIASLILIWERPRYNGMCFRIAPAITLTDPRALNIVE